MSIEADYIPEPRLRFGDYFEHEDSKTGLAEHGPFGRSIDGLHPSEVKLGYIGTRETISGAQEWIEECGTSIESEKRTKVRSASVARTPMSNAPLLDLDVPADAEYAKFRYDKILNPDFVGFSRESPFACRFSTGRRWERYIEQRELQRALAVADKEQRIRELVDLIDGRVESIATTSPAPDVIIIALTQEMVDEAHSVPISGNFHLNLRRAIKARAMKWGVPVQLIKRQTVIGGGAQLQDRATRAWNFCTAQYYKADGVPWCPTGLEENVCYLGISFYVARDVSETVTMRSSVAQAFDYLGQGLIVRGDPFEWKEEEQGRSPHLTSTAARRLIESALSEYIKLNGAPPRRVVIHKSSLFWGSEHGNYDEIEGVYSGIDAVCHQAEVDMVALRQCGIYLFREGKYPPLRGTYFCVDGTEHFLYAMGYVPYLLTYPGVHIPEPWQLVQKVGGSAPKDLLREVLTLTKMNVNNCSFADGTPITLAFSESVGEVMKHVPDSERVRPEYKFYM